MVNINQNQKVYFPEKADEIIIEILEKNKLKETLEEAVKKIIQKKDCLINIVYDASRDFAEGKILEKDFAIYLQKKTGASTQVAEGLIKDIKEKLLPLTTKANIEKTKKTETERTIAVKPVRLINKKQDIDKKIVDASQIAKKIPLEEKRGKGGRGNKKGIIKKDRTNEELPEIKEIKKRSKKQDSYLEPIE